MTQEEFIDILDKKGYSYKIRGNKIIVTHGGSVLLDSLSLSFSGFSTSLPSGVVFRNGGDVYLDALTGGNFTKWKGNIEGIDPKRLLSFMISKGLFER